MPGGKVTFYTSKIRLRIVQETALGPARGRATEADAMTITAETAVRTLEDELLALEKCH